MNGELKKKNQIVSEATATIYRYSNETSAQHTVCRYTSVNQPLAITSAMKFPEWPKVKIGMRIKSVAKKKNSANNKKKQI